MCDALETDWLAGAGGFEHLHLRIGMRQDSQLGAGGLEHAQIACEVVVPHVIAKEVSGNRWH
jgi:hypothetical protein